MPSQAPTPTSAAPRPRTSLHSTTSAGSSSSQPAVSVSAAAVIAPGCAAAAASWVGAEPSEPEGQKKYETVCRTAEAIRQTPATVRRFMVGPLVACRADRGDGRNLPTG